MMTFKMQRGLGYDNDGNNSNLLCERDKQILEEGEWIRAGDVECPVCGYWYSGHPQVQGALWLRRTCEGTLVKL